MNINPLINSIADQTQIVPGSIEWNQAGIAAYSGQTGEHAAYGWRHDPLPSIPAVIANYGHRRTYYLHESRRAFGYNMGGRPIGWTPESPGDLADGRVAYFTPSGIVEVSGPEVEHLWLDPLWAVIDSPPVPIHITPTQTLPSPSVARVLAELLITSCMGQIRQSSTSIYPWQYGDRANSRIIDTLVQGGLRKALRSPEDIRAGNDFIDLCIAHYEEKGIGTNPRNPRPHKTRVTTFNSLYWLLPVFYDLWIHSQGERASRIHALLQRWSQWAADLETIVPGRGFDMSSFYIDTTSFSPPPSTLIGLVTEQDITFDLPWELWSFRACSVAAEFRPELIEARDRLRSKFPANPLPKQRKWLVEANREYA